MRIIHSCNAIVRGSGRKDDGIGRKERLTFDDLGCTQCPYVPRYDQRSRETASVSEGSQY